MGLLLPPPSQLRPPSHRVCVIYHVNCSTQAADVGLSAASQHHLNTAPLAQTVWAAAHATISIAAPAHTVGVNGPAIISTTPLDIHCWGCPASPATT
mmetsp:Transcript_19005/g.40929  ORF Transcript_19005/g.40929 Transcript_19005/m.40929 type:complete len:97 (+) Transcript_19005:473-763(+)